MKSLTIDDLSRSEYVAIDNIHSRFIQIKYDKEEVTLARSFGAVGVIEVR